MADTNVQDILEGANNALTFIKSIADTPGVNMLPYVSTVSGAIGLIQAAYGAGKNIQPYVELFKKTFDGNAPTQAELDALNVKTKELEAKIQIPLPPPDEGEPD